MNAHSETPNLDRLIAYGETAPDEGTREIYRRFLEGLTEDGAIKMLADDYIRRSVEQFENGDRIALLDQCLDKIDRVHRDRFGRLSTRRARQAVTFKRALRKVVKP